ncbi:FAD-dependent oxidoreductase [Pseudohalioglobus lutimaris]|uniref:FAD-binding protein n=1 Tax=Pseudohalioglobus lutimaris TaxID=1737061 RepID=A0A2N5X6C4_9GAMM|nr:FAD-dependent oxidoreductase [Pseudohalioglobus lutimaris]PLW70027.1 FAD-binding protein [Pseudohalioglobus lutimaris]
MKDEGGPKDLNRRRLLLAAGAASVLATRAPGAVALPSSRVPAWDQEVDVLVAGSGAGGTCAALEARRAGASVMVLESLAVPGGSSSLSGGVVYAGGGTALQRALKIEDSPEAMFDFLIRAGTPNPPRDKIQLYCEQSPEHFAWLVAQGVPYTEKFTADKGLPMGDESLYFSGTEQAWPARDYARPAPRGHVPGVVGMNGGRTLMEALHGQLRAAGVKIRTRVAMKQLVIESDGRVSGAVVHSSVGKKYLRARRGIVLACGGFVHNRDMMVQYAPHLSRCSVPWAGAGDQGDGINMGIAAGAASLRMHEGFAVAPIYPPENTIPAILVNASGQRFISEDSYHAVIGHSIAYQQQGKAWLITDQESAYQSVQDNFPLAAKSNSMGGLAEQLSLPRGALQNTVAYYNRYASKGEDPMFHKSVDYLRPLQGPPYKAWDISVDRAFFAAHTLGGLATNLNGEVLSSFGELIPGLFAVGRTTAGIPTAPYIASGLSVGDATFFGRRAGRVVAGLAPDGGGRA